MGCLCRINPATGARAPKRATDPTGFLSGRMKFREGGCKCVSLLSSACLSEVEEDARGKNIVHDHLRATRYLTSTSQVSMFPEKRLTN